MANYLTERNARLSALLARMQAMTPAAGANPLLLAALCLRLDFFDPDFYRERYADVANAELSPGAHYVQFGFREARVPGEWADQQELAQLLNAQPQLAQASFADFLEAWLAFDPSRARNAGA